MDASIQRLQALTSAGITVQMLTLSVKSILDNRGFFRVAVVFWFLAERTRTLDKIDCYFGTLVIK